MGLSLPSALSPPLSHGLHPLSGLLALHLLAAQVTIDRDRPALPARDRLALPTTRTLDPLFLDRHGAYPLLRRYF